MIITITILVLALIVSIYINFNLYNQVTQLEESVKKTREIEDSTVRLHDVMLGIFTKALSEMNRIDKNGAFSSDDEVGWAFNTIHEAIAQVKHHLLKLQGDDVESINEQNSTDENE